MNSICPPCAEHTLRNELRDFPEWHCGRPHYALWAFLPEDAALGQRVQAAQAHLAPWLLQGYRRQPHITVGVCGFLSATASQGDDFGVEQLQAQLGALRQLQPTPFAIHVGGLDSFSSVPYLAVSADAVCLRALRQCLAGNAAINSPPSHYTPHVTVGLYADAWPMQTLRKEFERFPDDPDLHLPIGGIQLLSYAAREIGGPLQRLADYDFSSGKLLWKAGAKEVPAAFSAVE